jgi:hypothetical protein
MHSVLSVPEARLLGSPKYHHNCAHKCATVAASPCPAVYCEAGVGTATSIASTDQQLYFTITRHPAHARQDFLKARGIVVDSTTVIQQAAVTGLSDSNSEFTEPARDTAYAGSPCWCHHDRPYQRLCCGGPCTAPAARAPPSHSCKCDCHCIPAYRSIK